jgi:hypothetical protein
MHWPVGLRAVRGRQSSREHSHRVQTERVVANVSRTVRRDDDAQTEVADLLLELQLGQW